jgi:hypothetical protein
MSSWNAYVVTSMDAVQESAPNVDGGKEYDGEK